MDGDPAPQCSTVTLTAPTPGRQPERRKTSACAGLLPCSEYLITLTYAECMTSQAMSEKRTEVS